MTGMREQEVIADSGGQTISGGSGEIGIRQAWQGGLEANAKVLDGHPRITVAEYAKNWGANLNVVGSHGYCGVDRFMLGSVAESVAIYAHCCVEVLRE
jgi:nucleotide-binding universal stress UspA family protein